MKYEMEDTNIDTFIPITSITSHTGEEVASNLYYYNIQIVNICFVGQKDNWVLVDAGMPKSASAILELVEQRFGPHARPKAIILTHGHFDHVGAVVDLVDKWQVPVFAHPLELPYLTGQQNYPEPDPTVEGGFLAKISSLLPNGAIDLKDHIHPLPADQTVPFLPDWKWIHTPGHSPGHISLFRERDRALIVGDAFLTVRQDALYKVLTQKQEICGPPRYFTTDWQAAFASVKKLHALQPNVAVTGHGTAISTPQLTEGLEKLVNEFKTIAVPDYGRYV
jgi:glyoxylase-like metal-dependent hydrolase (beta-lactamase superfamily II)